MNNFELTERPCSRVRATEHNVAILIDVCTQAFRVERVMTHMIKQVPWLDKNSLAANLDQLRDAVRAVEIVRNSMPSYEPDIGIPGKRGHELTRQQVEQAALVQAEVLKARTPSEEQKILRAAGLVK